MQFFALQATLKKWMPVFVTLEVMKSCREGTWFREVCLEWLRAEVDLRNKEGERKASFLRVWALCYVGFVRRYGVAGIC